MTIAASADIVIIMQRLTPWEGQSGGPRPIIPPNSAPWTISKRTHVACAMYLLSYHHALDALADSASAWWYGWPWASEAHLRSRVDSELDILARALDEFRTLCREVQISVADTIAFWDETVSALVGNLLFIPSFWQYLSECLFVPDCAFITQQTLIADFPSLRMNAETKLHAVAAAFTGLADIIEKIEAERVSSMGSDATEVEHPNQIPTSPSPLARSVSSKIFLGTTRLSWLMPIAT
ncbi:hypothetical protein B0H12DRAFT_1150878 [Mycena haematopus]|nr:hypothetical protein B0H12DRAFT_1150878 [Mycena haematopus]